VLKNRNDIELSKANFHARLSQPNCSKIFTRCY